MLYFFVNLAPWSVLIFHLPFITTMENVLLMRSVIVLTRKRRPLWLTIRYILPWLSEVGFSCPECQIRCSNISDFFAIIPYLERFMFSSALTPFSTFYLTDYPARIIIAKVFRSKVYLLMTETNSTSVASYIMTVERWGEKKKMENCTKLVQFMKSTNVQLLLKLLFYRDQGPKKKKMWPKEAEEKFCSNFATKQHERSCWGSHRARARSSEKLVNPSIQRQVKRPRFLPRVLTCPTPSKKKKNVVCDGLLDDTVGK